MCPDDDYGRLTQDQRKQNMNLVVGALPLVYGPFQWLPHNAEWTTMFLAFTEVYWLLFGRVMWVYVRDVRAEQAAGRGRA